MKLALDHADYAASNRQHDLDLTVQEPICPDMYRVDHALGIDYLSEVW